ncbi:hypothetical protein NMY22_g13907 [Coprinellus aureogranulatus]|nr:hypothetical protein NMY22_g13907 [Coprinellus aureogranulatus]
MPDRRPVKTVFTRCRIDRRTILFTTIISRACVYVLLLASRCFALEPGADEVRNVDAEADTILDRCDTEPIELSTDMRYIPNLAPSPLSSLPSRREAHNALLPSLRAQGEGYLQRENKCRPAAVSAYGGR